MLNFVIAIIIISFVTKKVTIENNEKEWVVKTLKTLQIVAIVLAITSIIVDDKYNPTFKFFGFIVYTILLFVLNKLRGNRITDTLLLALLPLYITSAFNDFTKYFFPSFNSDYDGTLALISLGALVWLVAYGIGASKQNKALAKEQEKSRIIQSENDILEKMVQERTSEIQSQKDELLKTLEQLKVTQDQLIQSEKLASLGELTAGIAHEIQNPLNFVNNFSEVSEELIDEVLEERNKASSERDEALENELLSDLRENLVKIHHHGKRASGIVKSMLEHSRSSDGNREPTDINVLADEYLRLAYHGLRAKDRSFNAKMETNFEENLPKIAMVSQDMGRVFLNIINNAFQSPLNKSGEMKKVTVTTKLIDNKVEISIADNGSGIPDEIKEKIFQPFFTTKPTGQGTGLGLSLAYDIVKAHGGDLKAESEAGMGSVFKIYIPVI